MSDFADKLVDRIARRTPSLFGHLLYRFRLAHKLGFGFVLAKATPDAIRLKCVPKD
ncbi:hypothetical protein ACLBWZ_13700 [Brucellaceae bacterium C25G]